MEGYCVENGPFARLSVPYLKAKSNTHCLSRGFVGPEKLREYGEWIRPEAIEELLMEPIYESFNLRLEDMAHNAIPRSVRGDFAIFTAPYGKLFLF